MTKTERKKVVEFAEFVLDKIRGIRRSRISHAHNISSTSGEVAATCYAFLDIQKWLEAEIAIMKNLNEADDKGEEGQR